MLIPPLSSLQTGHQVRLAARAKALTTQTSGLAPTYLQANLLVLPARYAPDFRLLCARNPVPCPLLAESATPGAFAALTSNLQLPVARDIDLRHDFPRYRVYKDGVAVGDQDDIEAEWGDDHVGFLVGCSYSFEAALAQAGLPPRQVLQERNVPMYRTALPLCSAGVFTGAPYVVSMRPYRAEDIEMVREVTRPFGVTHGEPVAWGWEGAKALGIVDITKPEFGEASLRLDSAGFFDQTEEGYVPVFWGCGVTPQNAVMAAGLEGTVMAHAPGHMIVLDIRDHELFPVAPKKVSKVA